MSVIDVRSVANADTEYIVACSTTINPQHNSRVNWYKNYLDILQKMTKTGLTLELVTHFFYSNIYMFYFVLSSSICIQTEHRDIEIHIKYRNKKWVTNSKGSPKNCIPVITWL